MRKLDFIIYDNCNTLLKFIQIFSAKYCNLQNKMAAREDGLSSRCISLLEEVKVLLENKNDSGSGASNASVPNISQGKQYVSGKAGKAICFTSGKQYVLCTLDCRCFPRLRLGKHRQSRVYKTYCFPRSQSISVNYQVQ